MRVDITRILKNSTFTELEKKKYFDCKQNQFLHNIDTLYYSVSFIGDSNENRKLDFLISVLKDLKEKIYNNTDVDYFGLSVKHGSFAQVYNFRLSLADKFDIFIADYIPNKDTPRVVVQIRATSLWLDGYLSAIADSFTFVDEIFKSFDMEVLKVVENRIDYAFHTNAIQNPYKFFSDANLDKYLHTNLDKYYKIGKIRKSGFTLDYFALGQLKSNNVFNRNYNKVREVIELGYKAYFFDIWYSNKMISFYDKYCMEYAYKDKNYDSLEKARLQFYLDHGKDYNIKQNINALFNDKNARYQDFKDYADSILPSITCIMNIEFQTKRKFYYYADAQIELLQCKNMHDYRLARLFKIIDNRKLFIDYITLKNVAFIKDYDSEGQPIFMTFWQTLRNTKYKDAININSEYLRIYNHELDTNKKLKDTINHIAALSVYKDNKDSKFKEDVQDLLSTINDNDIHFIGLYNDYKEKKYKAIKNRIPSNFPGSSK